MHCVAGDGLGILIGAVIGSKLHLSPPGELALEYVLGFGIGWTIFSSTLHARYGGRLVQPLPASNIHSGIPFHERTDGRHGASHDDLEGPPSRC